jgi:hypothetical protein
MGMSWRAGHCYQTFCQAKTTLLAYLLSGDPIVYKGQPGSDLLGQASIVTLVQFIEGRMTVW